MNRRNLLSSIPALFSFSLLPTVSGKEEREWVYDGGDWYKDEHGWTAWYTRSDDPTDYVFVDYLEEKEEWVIGSRDSEVVETDSIKRMNEELKRRCTR